MSWGCSGVADTTAMREPGYRDVEGMRRTMMRGLEWWVPWMFWNLQVLSLRMIVKTDDGVLSHGNENKGS